MRFRFFLLSFLHGSASIQLHLSIVLTTAQKAEKTKGKPP